MTETILEEAIRITSRDRQVQYGHPADHHGATAAAFGIYLRRAGRAVDEMDAVDWEVGMMLDKIMRLAESRKRDTVVDIAGYARCVEMSLERLSGESEHS